jgi:putative tryptophan/tyrosine transport system substrate-binding protein
MIALDGLVARSAAQFPSKPLPERWYEPLRCLVLSLGEAMRRREFIPLLVTAAAWPLAARAQQSAAQIGFLSFLPRDKIEDRLKAFGEGLGEAGYADGKNVTIEFRSADGDYSRFPAMAADLVKNKVDVIVANTNAAALAAKAATANIPIVFYIGSDPVQLGIVDSLNRSGNNLTGVFIVTAQEVEQKRLEILHEAVPSARKLGILINPTSPNSANLVKDAERGARALGLETQAFYAVSMGDLETVFASYRTSQCGALLMAADLSFFNWSKQLAALTTRDAVPAINQWREFALAGGLMSYGSNFTDSFRQIGVYTGRILRGEKPTNLPVQQTTKVDLVVNLKAAKALGVNFPLSLLGRADEVIE